MPSRMHELLVDMFRRNLSLAPDLLVHSFGLHLPGFESARLAPTELTDVPPTGFHADAVLVLSDGETPVLGIIVEVQLRPDQDKRWTWPLYVVTLRARLRCPAVLVVLCVDRRTADWCGTPIEIGHPEWTLLPLVVGPERIPVVTDPAMAARSPELAVLSAMVHRRHPQEDKVLDAMVAGLDKVEHTLALSYSELVFAVLPAAARAYLEALMSTETYEYQSEFMGSWKAKFRAEGQAEGRAEGQAKGRAEGLAEGEAKAVLLVLDARKIELSDAERARIRDCTDLEQLEHWVRRAAVVGSVEELFD